MIWNQYVSGLKRKSICVYTNYIYRIISICSNCDVYKYDIIDVDTLYIVFPFAQMLIIS